MRIAILGPTGQVGRALIGHLGKDAVALDREHADLGNPEALEKALERAHAREPFDALINAAAYTRVDLAESETEQAHRINAEGPAAIARWCTAKGIPWVHYSTDYVFPGDGDKPWTEDAPTAPLNAYGRTKLAGERAVTEAGGRYLIFRTSWLYDASGINFVNTMLKLGKDRETLNVVNDQVGAPTYTPHLAAATLTALESALRIERSGKKFPSGIYHLCSQGETSWHGFAEAIFERARAAGIPLKVSKVEAIPSTAYPTPAARPKNSRLSQGKTRSVLLATLPDWEAGLTECMEARRQ